MKREDLQRLGLNEDQIKAVMAAHGQDMNNLQEKLDGLTNERDGLKDQVKQRDTQLAGLEKNVGNNKDLQNQIKKLQADNKALANDYSAKLANQEKSFKIQSALRDAKAKNVKTVLALIDTDKVSVGDDGKLVGLNDQVEAAKRSDGYLFAETSRPKVEINNGFKDGGNNGQKGDSIVANIANRFAKAKE